MSTLRNRVVRLEQKSPAQTGVTHIVRTVVSGGHGKPIVQELHSIIVLGGGEFIRAAGETEAQMWERAEGHLPGSSNGFGTLGENR